VSSPTLGRLLSVLYWKLRNVFVNLFCIFVDVVVVVSVVVAVDVVVVDFDVVDVVVVFIFVFVVVVVKYFLTKFSNLHQQLC